MPIRWNELYNILREKKPQDPPLPLILAAWWEVGALLKQLRFIEHLVYAEKQNQLDEISEFLHRLPEDEWFHLGD